MESTDLKPTPPDDPQLEAWLRASTAHTPLPDDGFSRRVLATLPPPASRSSTRIWVCVGGTLVGAVCAGIGAATSSTAAPVPSFTASELDLTGQLTVPAALGIAAVSMWFALRRQLQQLLRW